MRLLYKLYLYHRVIPHKSGGFEHPLSCSLNSILFYGSRVCKKPSIVQVGRGREGTMIYEASPDTNSVCNAANAKRNQLLLASKKINTLLCILLKRNRCCWQTPNGTTNAGSCIARNTELHCNGGGHARGHAMHLLELCSTGMVWWEDKRPNAHALTRPRARVGLALSCRPLLPTAHCNRYGREFVASSSSTTWPCMAPPWPPDLGE